MSVTRTVNAEVPRLLYSRFVHLYYSWIELSRGVVSSTVQAAIFAISVPVSPIDEDDGGLEEEEELWPNEKIAMCRSRGTRNVLVVIIKLTSLSPFRGA